MSWGAIGKEILGSHRRLAHLELREAIDDLRGQFALGQQHGLQVLTQRGFNRGDERRVDFDAGSEDATHASAIDFGIVQAAQHRLRAFGQAFALGDQLLERLETRLPLRGRALQFIDLVVQGVPLTTLFSNGIRAGFELLIQFITGGFLLFDVRTDAIVFMLRRFTDLGGGLAIPRQCLMTLAIIADLSGQALRFGLAAGELAVILTNALTCDPALMLDALTLGHQVHGAALVLVQRHLTALDVLLNDDDLLICTGHLAHLLIDQFTRGFHVFLMTMNAVL